MLPHYPLCFCTSPLWIVRPLLIKVWTALIWTSRLRLQLVSIILATHLWDVFLECCLSMVYPRIFRSLIAGADLLRHILTNSLTRSLPRWRLFAHANIQDVAGFANSIDLSIIMPRHDGAIHINMFHLIPNSWQISQINHFSGCHYVTKSFLSLMTSQIKGLFTICRGWYWPNKVKALKGL